MLKLRYWIIRKWYELFKPKKVYTFYGYEGLFNTGDIMTSRLNGEIFKYIGDDKYVEVTIKAK